MYEHPSRAERMVDRHARRATVERPSALGREALLALQRTAGNQAVARMLGAASGPRLARALTTTAAGLKAAGRDSGAGTYRNLLRELEGYHRDLGSAAEEFEHLRTIRELAQGFLRNAKANGEDDGVIDYVTKVRTEAEAELEALAPRRAEAAFPKPVKYSFEWWFNYVFAEAVRLDAGAAKVTQAHEWAVAYHKFRVDREPVARAPKNDLGLNYRFADAGDKYSVLKGLMDFAFVAVKESDATRHVKIQDAKYEPQNAALGYPAHLPDLKASGLVYRSDSRKPLPEPGKAGEASIQGHGGSIPRTRQHHDADKVLREMNMLQDWNPLRDKDLRESLLVRLGKQDNDLHAVVSIAVDPRDAVKFPLPGSDKADGTVVSGGADLAHLYVIYLPPDSKVLDTSRLVTEETEARTGRTVSTFGRGELGSAGLKYESHLLHIVTERQWDDAPGRGQVAYVIGKVRKVEKLNEDKWPTLPKATLDGLAQVLEAIGERGPMNWIVHGEPAVRNARHREMEIMANQDRALIFYPEAGAEIDWPDYAIKVSGGDDATDVDVRVSEGTLSGKRRDGRNFYVDWRGYKPGKLVIDADVIYAGDAKEPRKAAPRRTVEFRPSRGVATFVSPAMNADVNGACEVRIRQTNPGIERIELLSDPAGTVTATRKEGDVWVFTWQPPATDGYVTLKANAVSRGGGEMQAASRRVRVTP